MTKYPAGFLKDSFARALKDTAPVLQASGVSVEVKPAARATAPKTPSA